MVGAPHRSGAATERLEAPVSGGRFRARRRAYRADPNMAVPAQRRGAGSGGAARGERAGGQTRRWSAQPWRRGAGYRGDPRSHPYSGRLPRFATPWRSISWRYRLRRRFHAWSAALRDRPFRRPSRAMEDYRDRSTCWALASKPGRLPCTARGHWRVLRAARAILAQPEPKGLRRASWRMWWAAGGDEHSVGPFMRTAPGTTNAPRLCGHVVYEVAKLDNTMRGVRARADVGDHPGEPGDRRYGDFRYCRASGRGPGFLSCRTSRAPRVWRRRRYRELQPTCLVNHH